MHISDGILVRYMTRGVVAAASQTAATLIAGRSADAVVPMLGASGAITTDSAGPGRGGTAFFAHIDHFVFGAAIGTSLVTAGIKRTGSERLRSQTAQ